MALSTFDRNVLDAYLETRQHAPNGHALTATNIARVLRSLDRLTAAATALRQQQEHQ